MLAGAGGDEARHAGSVAEVRVAVDDQVTFRQVLAVLE